jgi:hypothetical protein
MCVRCKVPLKGHKAVCPYKKQRGPGEPQAGPGGPDAVARGEGCGVVARGFSRCEVLAWRATKHMHSLHTVVLNKAVPLTGDAQCSATLNAVLRHNPPRLQVAIDANV